MPWPDRDSLIEIVLARIADVDDGLVEEAVDLTARLRGANLRRKPGTAELLSFVAALKGAGGGGEASFRAVPNWLEIARTTLLKNSADHDLMTVAELARLAP